MANTDLWASFKTLFFSSGISGTHILFQNLNTSFSMLNSAFEFVSNSSITFLGNSSSFCFCLISSIIAGSAVMAAINLPCSHITTSISDLSKSCKISFCSVSKQAILLVDFLLKASATVVAFPG
ncbi:hypothetical protein CsSME_00003356 [Camellia sinensis var. sinensis]